MSRLCSILVSASPSIYTMTSAASQQVEASTPVLPVIDQVEASTPVLPVISDSATSQQVEASSPIPCRCSACVPRGDLPPYIKYDRHGRPGSSRTWCHKCGGYFIRIHCKRCRAPIFLCRVWDVKPPLKRSSPRSIRWIKAGVRHCFYPPFPRGRSQNILLWIIHPGIRVR